MFASSKDVLTPELSVIWIILCYGALWHRLHRDMTNVFVWEIIQSSPFGHGCLTHFSLVCIYSTFNTSSSSSSCCDGCGYNYSCNQIRLHPCGPKLIAACRRSGAETLDQTSPPQFGCCTQTPPQGAHYKSSFKLKSMQWPPLYYI